LALAIAASQGKWCVYLKAERVRERLPNTWIVSSKPPREHAEILLCLRSARFQRFDTKADLAAHAKAWSEYSAIIEVLPDLARPPEASAA
jgi:hypothetical protein